MCFVTYSTCVVLLIDSKLAKNKDKIVSNVREAEHGTACKGWYNLDDTR
jgi:hypothetical protein